MILELQNELPELERLTSALETFASAHDLSEGTVFAVNLALEEIVTNIISYGYSQPGGHTIRIDLELAGSELLIAIEDDARAFDPFGQLPPDLESPVDERPVGGLGVHLVRTLMDECRYERRGTTNRLSLRKRLTEGTSLA